MPIPSSTLQHTTLTFINANINSTAGTITIGNKTTPTITINPTTTITNNATTSSTTNAGDHHHLL